MKFRARFPKAKPTQRNYRRNTVLRLRSAASRFGIMSFAAFTGRTGELLFRNIARTIVGVIPTAVTFMLTREAFVKYNSVAAEHADSLIVKALRPAMSDAFPVGKNITFIFGGFTVFREWCRVWQRAYDRLFSAPDEHAAAQAVRNMPKNLIKDAKDITPAEIACVAVGAFPLGAVKAAFINPRTYAVEKEAFAMARQGFVNDWLASVVAYVPFFEVADRIYDSASQGKDSPEYYRKLKGLPQKQDIPAGEKKFGFFTDDGIGRIAFRRGGSLLLGIAFFMGGQRLAKAAFGNPTPALTGVGNFLTNTAKEYAAFVPFFGYTAVSDLYTQGYDALFNKLEQKYAGKNAGRSA